MEIKGIQTGLPAKKNLFYKAVLHLTQGEIHQEKCRMNITTTYTGKAQRRVPECLDYVKQKKSFTLREKLLGENLGIAFPNQTQNAKISNTHLGASVTNWLAYGRRESSPAFLFCRR